MAIVSAPNLLVVSDCKNSNYSAYCAFDTRTTGKSRLLACGKRTHAHPASQSLAGMPSVIFFHSFSWRVRRPITRASLPLLGQIASSAQILQIQQMPLFLSLPTHAQSAVSRNPIPRCYFCLGCSLADAAFISALRCTVHARAPLRLSFATLSSVTGNATFLEVKKVF